MKEELQLFVKSIFNSYAAIFFSRSRWFGVLLLLLTMTYPTQGLCGLFCCMLVNGLSLSFCQDRYKTEIGLYGFNAVLIGIALGAFFPYNATLIGLIFALSVLVLLLTIALDGWLQKYGLPYLASPFLLCLWIVLLIFQQSESEAGFDLFIMESDKSLLYPLSQRLEHAVSLPEPLSLYLQSLGYVFFQSDWVSGIVLTVALIFFSRIAFTFSFLSFIIAYYSYSWLGMDIFHLPFLSFGFNFIFTALALGGCYLVPSRVSFLCVIFLIPVQYLVILSSTRLLSYMMLPTFSLAFCSVSVLFLYLLKKRDSLSEPFFSTFMEATPEDNVYYHLVNRIRFEGLNYYPVQLPCMGEWKVSQGYNGNMTHQGLWKHAWDFVIENNGSQFDGKGLSLNDYYCYGKPVVATYNGVVVSIENDVHDNSVGEKNFSQNWGNYVILRHAAGLYSLVAHLQPGSVTCQVGQQLSKGAVLGLCGNSGLSPYPHLHFQFQAYPYVGAPTIEYKLSSYWVNDASSVSHPMLCSIPEKGESVSNRLSDETRTSAYQFRIGDSYTASSEPYGTETWNVQMEYGYSFLYCPEKNAKAWFTNEESDFCFSRFEGCQESNLYHFFLSNYRVLFADRKYDLRENYPLSMKHRSFWSVLQDFLAPLCLFMEETYEVVPSESFEHTSVWTSNLFGRCSQRISYFTKLNSQNIESIEVQYESKKWTIHINNKTI